MWLLFPLKMKRVFHQKDALYLRRLFRRYSAVSIVPRPNRRSDGGELKWKISHKDLVCVISAAVCLFSLPWLVLTSPRSPALIYLTSVHQNSGRTPISAHRSLRPNLPAGLTSCTEVWNQRGPALRRISGGKVLEILDDSSTKDQGCTIITLEMASKTYFTLVFGSLCFDV